jgi:tetratricopeptide (TPR) repeat protein
MELANTAFAKGNYEEASSLYEDLRTTYPDSEHQFDAHFLGLKSEMQTYVSYEYDGQALDRADKLLKQIHRQFPNESREHEEYLRRIYAEIQYRRAERLIAKARYRINRGENQAAVGFLQQIAKDYPDTPFAEEARTQLANVSDLPADPERHFQWLADMVPHNDPVSKIRREMGAEAPSATAPDNIKPLNDDSMIADIVDGMTTPDEPKQARVADQRNNNSNY